jgi:hypothetical protein
MGAVAAALQIMCFLATHRSFVRTAQSFLPLHCSHSISFLHTASRPAVSSDKFFLLNIYGILEYEIHARIYNFSYSLYPFTIIVQTRIYNRIISSHPHAKQAQNIPKLGKW